MLSNDPEKHRRDATPEEIESLPHSADSLPLIVWVALAAAAVERFTFYAVTTPWQNYLQNAPNETVVPGQLGLGQEVATNINNAFYFFSFLAPLPFAIISDTRLGRYKTFVASLSLNICGCLTLFLTSLSIVTHDAVRIFGLAMSMLLLGLGTGGIKAVVSPFIGDQYPETAPQMALRGNDDRVIIDRSLTLEYIYNVLYWLTNVASLSLVAATFLEHKVGFWASFLVPLCSSCVSIPLVLLFGTSFIKHPPRENVLSQARKVVWIAIRNRFKLDAAKSQFQARTNGKHWPWDDEFVDEIRKGWKACQVMACFVPFYVCMSQISTNLISQAGQMRGVIPNDMVQVFNDISCIVMGPVIQEVLYPILRKYGMPLRPISRMAFSFVATSAAMAYAAVTQHLIYSSGPCFEKPLACAASAGGSKPNDISIWVQVPVYFLLAVGEIIGFATLSEYSYTQAPKDMRSFIQALRQMTAAVGAAIAMALSPLSNDPDILVYYASLAGTMALIGPGFWLLFKGRDQEWVETVQRPQTSGENESQRIEHYD